MHVTKSLLLLHNFLNSPFFSKKCLTVLFLYRQITTSDTKIKMKMTTTTIMVTSVPTPPKNSNDITCKMSTDSYFWWNSEQEMAANPVFYNEVF